MNVRRAAALTIVMLLASATVHAMSSQPSSPPPPPTGDSGTPAMNGNPSTPQVSTARQQAEQDYADAYESVGKAKKDLEDGKAKNAEKKFRHAMEQCEKAVLIDERYHEAWNLLGFTSRKLGDYDKAFKAYDRCLSIKPDYAQAREYLGEAWLEKGDAKQAKVQLIWLERLGATEELKVLKGQYDAFVAAHPDAAPAPSSTPQAPADTTTAAGAGSGH